MSENDEFEEGEEEMETEAAAPAEEAEAASRTQGTAEEQHAAIGEVREGSTGRANQRRRWVAYNPLRVCRNLYNRKGKWGLDSGRHKGKGCKR